MTRSRESDGGESREVPVEPEVPRTILETGERVGERGTKHDRRHAPGALARYPVEGTLGRGGMGEVLLVRDPDLDRELAAKVVLERAGSDRLLRKFLLEARITGKLEHPNIVPVHELGQAPDGRAYFTMKRVRGRDLSAVLDEVRGSRPSSGSPPSLAALLEVFLKVADAIAFAHSRGVIHRDLKPANVMVGEFGEVLVMDWGLAKVVGTPGDGGAVAEGGPEEDASSDPMRTQEGAAVGTPAYMSPEQALGEIGRLDARSDIYSLGALLYEMLTLEPPYTGADARVILAKAVAGRVVRPSERAAGREIPRELEAAVLKAMAPVPSHRYSSVAEFRADIEAYLAGRALSAAEYSPWQLLAKWARRNKVAVLGGASTAVALAAGVIAVAIALASAEAGKLREQRERAEALHEEGTREWERARSDAPFNPAAPGDYFQRHIGALILTGQAIQDHPEAPSGWSATLSTRAREIQDRAQEVGDWAMAQVAARSARAAGAIDEAETTSRLDEVARARERAEEEDRARLDEVLSRIREIEGRDGKRGARVIPGEIDERARRLAARAGPGVTRRAIELLVEHPPSADSSRSELGLLGRAFLLDVLGRRGDVRTASGGTNALRVVRDEIEFHARHPAPEAGDVAAAAIVAAARLERAAPGSFPHELADRSARAFGSAGPVAAARTTTRRLLDEAAGPLALPAGDEVALRERLADLSDRVAASVRTRVPYVSYIFERTADFAATPRELAFLYDQLGLVGAGVRGEALEVLRNGFERAFEGFRRGEALALEPAVAAAAARSRLGDEEFAATLYRCRLGARRVFASRTEVALLLSPERADPPGTAREFHERGVLHLGRLEIQGAIEDFSRAIELDPELADAYHDRGEARSLLGERDAALDDLARVLALDSGRARAYASRGNVRQDCGDLEGALEDYSRAIALDPTLADAHAFRAIVRQERGDLAGAMEDHTRAIELDPENGAALMNRGNLRSIGGDPAGAIEDYSRAILLQPNLAAAYHNRGRVRYELGDTEGAMEDAARAIAIDPNLAGPYAVRGRARRRAKDLAGALEDLSRAILLEPNLPLAHVERGAVRLDQGDPAGAIEDCTRALAIDPRFAEAYVWRGVARCVRGDLATGVEDLSRGIELDPSDARAFDYRGQALAALGRPAGAIEDFTRSLELGPQDALVLLHRATARAAAGDPAGAAADATRAIELDPGLAAAFDLRAYSRLDQGDRAGAIEDWTRVIALDPGSVAAHANRAGVRCETGDLAGAIEDASRAVDLEPRTWQAWLHLGIARARTGDPDRARPAFARALESCPPEARGRIEEVRRSVLGE